MSDVIFYDEDNEILFTLENARYSQVIQAGRDLEDEEIDFWIEQVDEDEKEDFY